MTRARELMSGEQQFWTFEQLYPKQPVTNVAICFELDQAVPPGHLHHAVAALVERHEVLRTSYHSVGGRPLAQVDDDAETAVLTLCADSREQALELVRWQVREPFDLTRAPQLRVVLVSWRGDRHFLLLAAHHITLDGTSLAVISAELSAAIEAYARDSEWKPDPLPLTYSELAAAEHAAADDGSWDAALGHWHTTMETASGRYPLTQLSPGGAEFGAHSRTVRIDAGRAGRIRAFAQSQRVSTTILFMTCWSLLLQRLGGGCGLVLGVPVSGRATPEQESLVGLVMNTVPVALPVLDTGPSALRTVRNRFLQALRYRNVPFLRMARAIRPGHSLETDPLYQVMFTHRHESVLTWGDRAAPHIDLPRDSSEAPLSMGVTEEATGTIRLGFDVATHDFDASFADRLVAEYQETLLRMVGSAASDGAEGR
ncbi:hypothetical protein KMT30_06535 [Streptomyces sp. IBSBF 2953]|nr:hypothetical protein [Streptomyces hayashii]